MKPNLQVPPVSTRPAPKRPRLINGTRVDTVRRNLGLTHEGFADRCGVPFKTMKRICEGRNVPDGNTLTKIIKRAPMHPDVLETDGWERYE